MYSECSNVVLLLPVAAIFTPIDFARPGGREKKVGSFFTHTCVETDMLGFRTFSPKTTTEEGQKRGENVGA